MNKYTKIISLAFACLFLFIGIKSTIDTKPYAELNDIQTFDGMILKLHCPHKGAAALSLENSDFTFNLSVRFRADYCQDDESQTLLGKVVSLKARQVNGDFYQAYEIKTPEQVILTPEEIEADQGSSTFGMFFLAFLILAFVGYKSRKKK
ncbi:hypothetical protein FGD67_08210 [Colwellia sp. M166]|uniref:hypothetical protein n=1 Tax=Colwellia sp. M166 TaxID=2583805 RepID=UPI00211E291E|nr:hypothetical protein [Colwellia sp. M166]UUO23197.1 hypothetical protein FGD67_08210 [Colwellia sp. M166]|tara:strand:- start:836 stop:1285 length:450 start_codon:yes stop_codon:yes gene_type:complete